MIVHGEWVGPRNLKRPVIQATFVHERLGRQGLLEFVVDTAADRTVILRRFQKQIPIRDYELNPVDRPIPTIAGLMNFSYLSHCTLVFVGKNGETFPVKDLHIHFNPVFPKPKLFGIFPRRGGRQPQAHSQRYNILGRDVLSKYAFGCCNPEDVLFLTKHTTQYANAFKDLF